VFGGESVRGRMGVLAAGSMMDGDAHGTERKHGWRIMQKERGRRVWARERERMCLQVNRIKRKICLQFPSELLLSLSAFSLSLNGLSASSKAVIANITVPQNKQERHRRTLTFSPQRKEKLQMRSL